MPAKVNHLTIRGDSGTYPPIPLNLKPGFYDVWLNTDPPGRPVVARIHQRRHPDDAAIAPTKPHVGLWLASGLVRLEVQKQQFTVAPDSQGKIRISDDPQAGEMVLFAWTNGIVDWTVEFTPEPYEEPGQ